MIFGRKTLSKLDADTAERLSLAYLTALDEIEALVGTIKGRLAERIVRDRDELRAWHTSLVRIHTRALEVAKSLPSTSIDCAALAQEARSMELEVSHIAETVWGEDEARVAGFIMAEGILTSNG